MQTKEAPQAPTPPPNPVVVIDGMPGSGTITIPMTSRDLAALKARREQLSDQLVSVDNRRSKLINQLNTISATGDETAKKGLVDRLSLLDKRQLQLEADLAETGQQLSGVSAGLLASTSAAPVFAGFSSGQALALSIVFTVCVLGPLAAGFARALWKRASRPAAPPQVFNEAAQRLERLEGAVDAIAIEIERISEGQRFVTKLLSENQPAPMLGAGQRSAEPVR
jgi:hypothetical protein